MEHALCSGLSPGPGASLQSHKGLAGAESHEVMSTGRRNGLGAGEWEGQPLPATAPHPSKDFHLLNCEQKPKTFDSYRSGGGEKISGRKMRGEVPHAPMASRASAQRVRSRAHGLPQPGTAAPPPPQSQGQRLMWLQGGLSRLELTPEPGRGWRRLRHGSSKRG